MVLLVHCAHRTSRNLKNLYAVPEDEPPTPHSPKAATLTSLCEAHNKEEHQSVEWYWSHHGTHVELGRVVPASLTMTSPGTPCDMPLTHW